MALDRVTRVDFHFFKGQVEKFVWGASSTTVRASAGVRVKYFHTK